MHQRPDPARPEETARLPGLRPALHAPAPARRHHGLGRGRVRRLLPVRPVSRRLEADDPRPSERWRSRDGTAPLATRRRHAVAPARRPDVEAPRSANVLPVTQREEILLGHGSGGKLTAQLVERMFLPVFRDPAARRARRPGVLDVAGARLAFTTDSYVVTPIFFPGGDIGELAVNGTVNDLAMGGARPLFLSRRPSSSRRGFRSPSCARRRTRCAARARTRRGAHRHRRHEGGGPRQRRQDLHQHLGHRRRCRQGSISRPRSVRPGDAILLSGTIGDHGIAVLSQREGLEFEGDARERYRAAARPGSGGARQLRAGIHAHA